VNVDKGCQVSYAMLTPCILMVQQLPNQLSANGSCRCQWYDRTTIDDHCKYCNTSNHSGCI